MVKKSKNLKKAVIIDKLRNFKKDLLTIPNLLTSIRILFVPVVLLFIWKKAFSEILRGIQYTCDAALVVDFLHDRNCDRLF